MASTFAPLTEFLSTYDRAAHRSDVELAEQERRQILERFPLDGWSTLTLERYALGQDGNDDTFCRWMEFRSPNLGSMRGGSARKHLIFKSRKREGWHIPEGFKDQNEAWKSIRGAFVDALRLAQKQNWNAIDELLPLRGAPVLKLKTLHLYFPSEILPIYSQPHLRHFLRLLGSPASDDFGSQVVRLARALKDAVRSRRDLADWSPIEVMHCFYRWAPPGNGDAPAIGVPAEAPAAPSSGDLHRDIGSALERKGQAILYGPPGTGKTFHARRFAVAWLLEHSGRLSEVGPTLADPMKFNAVEAQLSTAKVSRRVWWVVANPKEWSWDRLFKEKRVGYRYGRLRRNYPQVQAGDLVVGYQSTPDKRIVALARVTQPLGLHGGKEPTIELEPVVRVKDGPTYDELAADAVMRGSEPMRFRNQGTLFGLTSAESEHILAILGERNADLSEHVELEDAVGPLTRLTFHPSYSYEDFVEGFRPVDTADRSLALRLTDGVFKRVCLAALAEPDRKFLVLVDEINRANLSKVFGELITLLEADKRGMTVTLPQSREAFCIPPNVFLLGTMNTSDRSIKLLDAALRRRFAFIELMPDVDVLEEARVGPLALDDFLIGLNRRIARQEGREKQIGHSFLMRGDDAITEPDEFAHRFRQDILPLLQEFCYDDYAALARFIGTKLVKADAHTLDHELLSTPDKLLEVLAEEFTGAGPAGS